MTFAIRAPELRDAAELADLHVATWREAYSHLLRASAFYVRNGFCFDGVEQTDPHAPLITDARMVR